MQIDRSGDPVQHMRAINTSRTSNATPPWTQFYDYDEIYEKAQVAYNIAFAKSSQQFATSLHDHHV